MRGVSESLASFGKKKGAVAAVELLRALRRSRGRHGPERPPQRSCDGPLGAERDPQHQVLVHNLPGGITDQSEIQIVGFGLIDELLALGSGNRWQRSIPDCGRTLLVAIDHRVNIQFSHIGLQ